MKRSSILSLFLLIAPISSFECPANSSFELTLSEDMKAYKSRHMHIFHEAQFKHIAELIKCHVGKTVKEVNLEEVNDGLSMERICSLKEYSEKLANTMKRHKMYMTTVTRQQKYSQPENCDAQTKFNFMKTEKSEWAVHVRGPLSEMMLPMDSMNGSITEKSLNFALNALFFANAYGTGDSEFKSLGDDDDDFKQKLLTITGIVYILAVFIAAISVIVLFVLFFARRRAKIQKRESDKSKLLRNPANNNLDDAPVEIVYDTSDNKT